MPIRAIGRSKWALGALALLAFCATPAGAQWAQQPVNPPGGANSDLYGKDNTAGVFVRDSAIAMEKLVHAQHMQDMKEWNTSADLYQEILEKYPDRVVPARTDDRDQVIQYTSVTETVREALCKWPPEGLDVYRGRYETTAANMLASAAPGDLPALHKILSMYFPTESAKKAGLLLMDDYFELGDYSAVAQIGRELLTWHPNLVAERPGVLYRVAIAEKLTGDTDAAQTRLSELHRRFAQVTGTIRGTDVVLADALQGDLAAQTKIVRGAESDSWPMLGGNPGRSKVSSSQVKPGAKLYDIALDQPSDTANEDPATKTRIESANNSMRQNGSAMGVMPVVDQNELFFQDNTHVFAVSLDSGIPLPGWMTTYPSQNGQYKLPQPATALPAGEQLCVSITDRYVVAVMGITDQMGMYGRMAQRIGGVIENPDSRLVCLNRQTGKEVWNTSLRQLPEDKNTLRDLHMGGSPLVIGNNLYIMARGGQGGQFEDCYALCFDVNTGKLLWSSYVASANGDSQYIDPRTQGMMMSDPFSHLAYASGRLFVITNLGAVASLDAYNGTVAWLNIYRDVPVTDNNMMMGGGFRRGMMIRGGGGFGGGLVNGAVNGSVMATQPWLYNPAIVENGKVFVFPRESTNQYIYIYDAGTGRELKRFNVNEFHSAGDSSPPQTILAANDDYLILAGPNSVWRIPWQIYDSQKNQVPTGYWSANCGARLEQPNEQDPAGGAVRGLAFVTDDYVYLSTVGMLKRISMKSGLVESTFPADPNVWDPATQGPGNIVVTQDHVIIAGDKRVDVYTDLDMARQKLDRAIAANPTDPEARLNYSEVMFAVGQSPAAEQHLDEAIGLLGGIEHMRTGPARDRAFNDALNFATKLSAKSPARDPELIDRLFDRAGSAAQTPSQQVMYRVGRIAFDNSRKDDAAVMQRYQEILADDAMRLVVIPDPQTNGASQAGAVAEKAIAAMLETDPGRAAYQTFEKAAKAKFADAQSAGSADLLLAVAKSYPNSQVAPDAMLAAADAYESHQQWRQAAMVLRQVLNSRHEGSSRTPLLEAMVRNYLKIPGCFDVAVSRIGLAAATAPNVRLSKPFTLPDGSVLQNISYKEAHEALVRFDAKASTDLLPDFHLPTSAERAAYNQTHSKWMDPLAAESAELRISNVTALLCPLDGFQRSDRIATWTKDAGVSIYSIGKTTPLATSAGISDAPLGSAWIDNRLAVWTGKNLAFVGTDSSKPKWGLAMDSLPAIEVAANNVPPPAPANPNINGQMQQVIQQNGQVFIINNGQINGRIIVAGGGQLIINGQAVNQQGQRPANAQTPTPDPAAGEQILQVVPIGDQIIVATTTGRVMCVDCNDGKVTWQTRFSEHACKRVVANADFTVLRIDDESAVQLIVLNSFSGELVGRKAFSLNTPLFPVNMVLSPDGILAYTMPDRLCIQDLFEANTTDSGMEPKFTTTPTRESAQMFLACNQPNQLLAAQGRIFAVANHGSEVRIFSADTGQPWTYHDVDANGNVPGVVATGANDPTDGTKVFLKITGDYLYIQAPKIITAFQIDHPAMQWNLKSEPNQTPNYTQMFFGKNDLIAVDRTDRATNQRNQAGKSRLLTLDFVSRDRIGGQHETGLLFATETLRDPSGITDLLPVDGGLVYRTDDGIVHTLLGVDAK